MWGTLAIKRKVSAPNKKCLRACTSVLAEAVKKRMDWPGEVGMVGPDQKLTIALVSFVEVLVIDTD